MVSRKRSKISRKAATLAWKRSQIAMRVLKKEFDRVSYRGWPDLIAFRNTGTFRFVELKNEEQIPQGINALSTEQLETKKILDRIGKKPNYEVWYFGAKPSTKKKIIAKCWVIGRKLHLYEWEDDSTKEKFKGIAEIVESSRAAKIR